MAADTRTDREIMESIYERLGRMIEMFENSPEGKPIGFGNTYRG